jgi:hypothetical protein
LENSYETRNQFNIIYSAHIIYVELDEYSLGNNWRKKANFLVLDCIIRRTKCSVNVDAVMNVTQRFIATKKCIAMIVMMSWFIKMRCVIAPKTWSAWLVSKGMSINNNHSAKGEQT